MKKGLGIIFMLGGICLFSACEQDGLYLGKPVDESQYEGIYKDNSFAICDAQSGSQITVVELYNQDFFKNYATYIRVELSKPANREMNAQVSIDPEYLVTYNKEHFTDFKMYPQTLIELGHTEIALEEDNEVPQTEIVQIAILSSRFPDNLIKYGENSLVDGNDSNKAIEIFVAAKRFVPRSNFLFTVDMQNAQTFSGIRVKYLGSNPSNFYKEVTISLSSNNSTWTKVGTIENAVEKNGASDFIFLVPVKAQYIKIEMDIPIKEADYINITEVTVYQKSLLSH